MNTKLLITIIILLILLAGGYFMIKNLTNLFGENNKTVLLEWQSKLDAPNPWEFWQDGPLFYVTPTERNLIELYYQNKFNPEKKILDYEYTIHKGLIILNYKQIKIQDKEDLKQNRLKWGNETEKVKPWVYNLGKRGLIIQISVSNKFKDKFLEEGWKIINKNDHQKSAVYTAEDLVKSDYNKFAVYLLTDKDKLGISFQQNLSELELESQPLFTANDIISYNWEKHSFVLIDSAEKRVATELKLINESVISFVVVVNGERIYNGIFQDIVSAAAYTEIPFIQFCVFDKDRDRFDLSAHGDVKNTHLILSYYFAKDNIKTDFRNDPRIKQVLKENGKIIFEEKIIKRNINIPQNTQKIEKQIVELVVIFKKDISFEKADKIMKQTGFTYRQGSDSSRGKMYSQLTGPKFILKFPANKYIDIFRAESYRDIPEIYEIYQAEWSITKD